MQQRDFRQVDVFSSAPYRGESVTCISGSVLL